jgi:2-polyprenyl-3-methyl-5-hydroxy-6-metoxy-1,4-benzoquinol methylase
MKKILQPIYELEEWHKSEDPWDYRNNSSDQHRLDFLLSEIPSYNYNNVLDIGCGQGFITTQLPGKRIYGVDISHHAINHAKKKNIDNIEFAQASIFELNEKFDQKFDLIVITGVLYPQYIGYSSNLIYLIIDKLLNKKGILVTVHIDEWYNCQFPFLKLKERYYPYREYNHKLEIYTK